MTGLQPAAFTEKWTHLLLFFNDFVCFLETPVSKNTSAFVGRENVLALAIRIEMYFFVQNKNEHFPSKGPVTLWIIKYTTIVQTLPYIRFMRSMV